MPADLLRAFGITERDLELNRQGRLGPLQVRRLRRGAFSNLAAMISLLASFTVIVLVTTVRPVQPWRWALLGACAAALVTLGVRAAVNLRRCVAEDRVDRYSGPVRTVLAGRLGPRLFVGDRNFALPIAIRRVVTGGHYAVYVAPRSKLIVAMEPDSPRSG